MNRISIIIPAYNCERTIRRCVDSVLEQSYKDYEIVIVDDGSEDNTAMICDEYAKKNPNIEVYHKKNGGVSSARNVGIAKATGEYIYFLDADDYLLSNTLQTMIENIGDCDILISSYYTVKNNTKKASSAKIYDNFIEMLCYNYIWAPWAKLVKKKCITSLFDEEKHVGEDLLFWINNAGNILKFKYIAEPLYNYIIYENSIMHSKKVNFYKHLTALDVYLLVIDFVDAKLKVLFMELYICSYARIKHHANIKGIDKKYTKYYNNFYDEVFKSVNLKHKIKLFLVKHVPKIYFMLRGE